MLIQNILEQTLQKMSSYLISLLPPPSPSLQKPLTSPVKSLSSPSCVVVAALCRPDAVPQCRTNVLQINSSSEAGWKTKSVKQQQQEHGHRSHNFTPALSLLFTHQITERR